MTAITIAASTGSPPIDEGIAAEDGRHLLALHQLLFPERYTGQPLAHWSAQTLTSFAQHLGDRHAMLCGLAARTASDGIAALLEQNADRCAADTLDAIADLLESACERLAVSGYVGL